MTLNNGYMAFAHNGWTFQPNEFRQAVHCFAGAGNIVNFGIGIARARGDDIDPLWFIFLIQALAQLFDIGFYRPIERVSRAPRQKSSGGGNIDNMTCAAFRHVGCVNIAKLRYGGQHALNHGRAGCPFMFCEASGEAVAGIIDQIINGYFALFDFGRQFGRRLGFFQIGRDDRHFDVKPFFQLLGERVEAGRASRRQNQVIIAGSQIACIIATNAGRGSGYEGGACFRVTCLDHNLAP